jgi:O-antigen ligase
LKQAWKESSESYFLGKGLGSKLIISKAKRIKQQSYTHNIVGYTIFTLGIPGLLLLFWLAWNTWRLAMQARKRIRDNEMLAVYYGYMVSLICVMTYVQFESVYRHFIFSLYMAMVLAIFARLSLLVETEANVHSIPATEMTLNRVRV